MKTGKNIRRIMKKLMSEVEKHNSSLKSFKDKFIVNFCLIFPFDAQIVCIAWKCPKKTLNQYLKLILS